MKKLALGRRLLSASLLAALINAPADANAEPFKFEVDSLDGQNGFRIKGTGIIGDVGPSLSLVGDVNGDSIADLLIGTPRLEDSTGTRYGGAVVVFGSTSGFPDTINLRDLDGTDGFRLLGSLENESAGTQVSAYSDINGDGINDLIISGERSGNFWGSTYVVYGSDQPFPAEIELNNLDGTNGFIIDGTSSNRAGHTVAGIGDINDDGFDDIAMGYSFRGRKVFVLYGSDQPFPATMTTEDIDGVNGFIVSDTSGEFGDTLSAAGDFNNDGIDDFMIGDPGNDAPGEVFVIFGNRSGFPNPLAVSTLNATNGFKINGQFTRSEAGSSIAPAGDVNNDGIDDIIVGSAGSSPGEAHIIYGRSSGIVASLDLRFLNSFRGVQITGEPFKFGISAAGVGDINGDLIDDVLIGGDNFRGTPCHSAQGRGYLLFGKNGNLTTPWDAGLLDGTDGFAIHSKGTTSRLGTGASGGGDINGDGLADFAVSAPYAPLEEGDFGEVYVVFGYDGDTPGDDIGPVPTIASITSPTRFIGNAISICFDEEVQNFDLSDLILKKDGETISIASASLTDLTASHYTIDLNPTLQGNGVYTLLFPATTDVMDLSGNTATTEVQMEFEIRTAFSIDTTLLDGTNGFVINGEIDNSKTAFSVAGRSDFNNDGYDDITLGAPQTRFSHDGDSYVIFGGPSLSSSEINVADLDGTNGFHLLDEGRLGMGVEGGTDFNQDNIDDILISNGDRSSSYGTAYVIYGTEEVLTSPIDLATTRGSLVLELSDIGFFDQYAEGFGTDAANSGDFNHDGFDDLIIAAAPEFNGDEKLAAVVFFSTPTPPQDNFNFGDIDGTNGVIFTSDYVDREINRRVTSLGDINGDGIDDIAIGSPNTSPNEIYSAGTVYVVFGSDQPFPTPIHLDSLTPERGFRIDGRREEDYIGWDVTGIDLNDDGLGDLVISSPYYFNENDESFQGGRVWVIYGSSTIADNPIDLNSLDGENGFTIPGLANSVQLGYSVDNAGDFNLDGIEDLIIGVTSGINNYDPNEAFILFGSDDGFPSSVDLLQLNGLSGITILGRDEDINFGFSVAGAGDINGDGVDDVIIGAPEAQTSTQNYPGRAYVIYGSDIAPQAIFPEFPPYLDQSPGEITIHFSEDVTGVDISDFVLTRDEINIDITSAPTNSPDEDEFRIDLTAFTTIEGIYRLTMNPASDIEDLQGIPLESSDPLNFIIDLTPPTALCANTQLVLDSKGEATLLPADVDGGSSDNFSLLSTSLDRTEFSCSDIGEQVVTLTATDQVGLTDTCLATVTVVDPVPPVPLCRNVIVDLAPNGTATITPEMVDAGSTDNCGISSISLSKTSFSCLDVGDQQVTLTVTDLSENTATCLATVTVRDVTPPVALCQDIDIELDDVGRATITPAMLDNGSSDNCTTPTLSLSKTEFSCVDIGEQSVTLTATDGSGNTDSCEATVTVRDLIKPVAICKDIEVELDANGSVTITTEMVDNGSSDNCAIATLSLDKTEFSCTDLGDQTVTLTVIDTSGNTDHSTATVSVKDSIAPVVACKDIEIELDANGTATLTAAMIDNGSIDNCGIPTLSIDKATFTCLDTGPQSVVLTATDSSGNSDECTATVTIRDSINPMALCQDIDIELDDVGKATITPAMLDNGSSDNCTTPTLSLSKTEFTCEDIGEQSVTLTATDSSGNTDTCEATVTVRDLIKPVAICKDIEVELDANGSVTITTEMVDNDSTDNCGIATLSLDKTEFSCEDIGEQTVTLTVTDSSGNSDTCTATVTVRDVTPPVALCKDIDVELDDSGKATITAAMLDGGSSDNCTAPTLTISQTEFACEDLGEQTVTLTATDSSGNIDSCEATVTVRDLIKPVAICKDIEIELDDTGKATLTTAMIDNGSSDNCTTPTLSLSKTEFSCEDIGEQSVTLTATDSSGNTDTCEATVTVRDLIKPVAICKDIEVELDANGSVTITTEMIDNDSTDNCAVATLSLDKTAFSCEDIGEQTVTLTVTDSSGNSDTCTATVTVKDNIKPTALCKDLDLELKPGEDRTITADMIDDGSSDNCGIATIVLDRTEFSANDPGAHSVTLTVTDTSGNTSTCTATVTVTVPVEWWLIQ